MTNPFKLLTTRLLACSIALWAATPAVAGAQDEHGFLNIVNLVPGTAPCKIHIAGQDALPGGLLPSRSTGWFIIPAGSQTLKLSIDGYAEASGALEVPVGKSSICVVFLQPVLGLDSKGKPARPRIRFKRCDTLPSGKGYSLRLMSFCAEETSFQVADKSVSIKLLETQDIPGWGGAGFKITRNRELVGEVPTEHEKGAFYLFFGTDHQENYCTTLVRAEDQTLPPWMKKNTP